MLKDTRKFAVTDEKTTGTIAYLNGDKKGLHNECRPGVE
jgi:hypothetical protein